MRALVIGGAGFLGAWIVRALAQDGHEVRIFDLTDDRRLVTEIAGEEMVGRIDWRRGDITDLDQVAAAAEGCDTIINLAGILTLACKDDPVRGAQINLIGTLNVFEAARRRPHAPARVVFTSSAGVYGLDDGTTPRPLTHYGAFKLACEGSARAYWEDHGVASTGFRPYVVYGPGRKTGLTASPTLACRAAARGEPFRFAYSGRSGLVFAGDVAAAYVAAALHPLEGSHVFNLPGEVASTEMVIEQIRRLVPDATLEAGGEPLTIAPDLDEDDLALRLPGLPTTGLREGIARTVEFYRKQTV